MRKFYIPIVIGMVIPSILYSVSQKDIISAMKQENYAIALTLLNERMNKNPNDNNTYRLYARLYYQIKDYDKALSNIQEALRLSQDNPTNMLVAGNIYRDSSNYIEAEKYYEKAIKMEPGYSSIYYEYAISDLKQFRIDSAERLLKLAQSFNPGNWKNFVLEAKIKQFQGYTIEAEKILFDAVNKFPQVEKILDEYASFYIETKQTEKALAVLQTANERFGVNTFRNEQIGNIIFNYADFAEALAYYQEVEKKMYLSPPEIRAAIYWKLYKLYQISDQQKEAIQSIYSAFSIEPDNQLYFAEYYNSLLRTSDTNAREKLASYTQKLAAQERKKGITPYYLSLLSKLIMLNPNSILAYNQLLDVAKLNQNQPQINNIISHLVDINKNLPIKNVQLVREHLKKTQQLNQDPIPFYSYKVLVYIVNNFNHQAVTFAEEWKQLSSLFPKIQYDIELYESFDDESQILFHNQKEYNLVINIALNNTESYYLAQYYDRDGLLLMTKKVPYKTKTLTKNILVNLQENMFLLPDIGFIQKRLPNSSFLVTLGAKNGLNTNQILSVFDNTFTEKAQLKPISIQPYTMSVSRDTNISTEYFDIDYTYVTPIIDTNTITNIFFPLQRVFLDKPLSSLLP